MKLNHLGGSCQWENFFDSQVHLASLHFLSHGKTIFIASLPPPLHNQAKFLGISIRKTPPRQSDRVTSALQPAVTFGDRAKRLES